jgi:hypothetical protein
MGLGRFVSVQGRVTSEKEQARGKKHTERKHTLVNTQVHTNSIRPAHGQSFRAHANNGPASLDVTYFFVLSCGQSVLFLSSFAQRAARRRVL